MFTHIPKARPAVDDRTLATLTQIARDAQHGNCTQAEIEWLVNAAAPLFEELGRYRANTAAQAAGATVIAMPFGGR